ncbi:MAG: hypothetical protein ACRDSZ_09900 [Pseudonocardiaceae bacterium]
MTQADRVAGYWWDISMRQIEVSRTIVFDGRQSRPSVYKIGYGPPTVTQLGCVS